MFKKISPYTLIVLSFIVFMFASAFILSLPIMLQDGAEVNFLNNLFTTTSALCVTGLSVYDIATTYSFYGQILILVLIQLGGIGIITFSSMIILLISRKMGFYTKKLIQEDLNYDILSHIPYFLKRVALIVFSIEIIGAIILLQEFIKEYPLKKAIYYSIFHSISAFCNAGFSLYSDSLVRYQSNVMINLTVASLIILGGIGFSTILDLYGRIKGTKRYFTLTTKFTVYITIILLILGTISIFGMEYTNNSTLGAMSFKDKILASFFQSVTLRTAGFSTFSQASMRTVTKIFSMLFMFIGASPGSTGGGIKTTTFGVIFFGVYYSIKNKEDITFAKRRIMMSTYRKATAIVFISFMYIFIAYIVLMVYEGNNVLQTLFELISAFGTVGLSLDYTAHLHTVSKMVIILTMFIGRIGPLTLAIALSQKNQKIVKYLYPTENILIG